MIELQNIFQIYGQAYRETHPIPPHHRKAMENITACRSAALGGHIDQCDSCGHISISYNSCRNRHCPKCQNLRREEWLLNREQELLNVGYFHVVFTVPASLNPLIRFNQKIMYDILFRAVSETLTELAADPKYLGAQIGFISLLHTWGQNLMDHPHIHCIVPGGGPGLALFVSPGLTFYLLGGESI
ncbi:MAG: transposase zinc-binding domain-containing protein [Firmicutes bacterium]|nr:transposase zinc-binding domain-containing protein [Bacillota bacterium]